MTLGAKAPHSKGDLSPMTEKTQKSKVVVLVKHMHTHTHPHTRLLDFSGYPPPLWRIDRFHIYISRYTFDRTTRSNPRECGGFRTLGQSFGKLVPEPLFQNSLSENHFRKLVLPPLFQNHFQKVLLKNRNPIPIARYAKTKNKTQKGI